MRNRDPKEEKSPGRRKKTVGKQNIKGVKRKFKKINSLL